MKLENRSDSNAERTSCISKIMALTENMFTGQLLCRRMSCLLTICLLTAGVLLTACKQDSIVKYTEQQILHSGFYQLRATHHMFPEPGGKGGGIAFIDGQWLIVPGDGTFHRFERSADGGDFQIRKLPYAIPMNRERFVATYLVSEEDKETWSDLFRVTDVVLHQSAGVLRLWISHHWWDERESCLTLRISTVVVDEDAFLNGEVPGLDWSTLYESTPCLDLQATGFIGLESGGKMVLSGSPPDVLYLTTGIHGFDGLESRPSFVQDPETSWGKVLKIDPESGAATVFTTGHRNPQGLFQDNLGRMWLTEHGPRGGDELNLLEQGKNYGWPLVS